MSFVEGAVTSVKEAVTFIGEGGLAIKRSFKTAGVKVDDVKGVNKRNLKQQLIIYKLKSLLVLINSLISISNYFVGLFS